MKRLLTAICLATVSGVAQAAVFVYPANCTAESHSSQGAQQEDLRTKPHTPISCTDVVLSTSANGIMVQFAKKTSGMTPIGFAGGDFDYDVNPNMATVHVQRIYLPHARSPSSPEVLSGVEGFCFVDGSINLKKLKEISCTAKIELGEQRIVYLVTARISGPGVAINGAP